MGRILIIDDDLMMNEALHSVVASMGHQVESAYTIREGCAKAAAGSFDVVFLDVRMPDGNGLECLPRIRATASQPEVIIVTAYSDDDGARLAIENGAWTYIRKPASLDAMTLPLVRALQYRQEKQRQAPVVLKRERIIGHAARLQPALEDLARAAASTANVLIQGETGTGKEVFARTLHENSARAAQNFVVVDCASLPESLVEGMLFGHVKGAFTGADRTSEGLIAQAHGGTLFLDEVGELPLGLQKAFLRVIQERSFRPLGADREHHSDFRLIAATNRNLEAMVTRGTFRRDLLFRLRALQIDLPPLRERREDILELVQFFVNRLSALNGTTIKGFSPDFFDTLNLYDWPGNVRELANMVEYVFATASQDATLFARHLPTDIRIHAARVSAALDQPSGCAAAPPGGDATPQLPSAPAGGDKTPLPDLRAFRKQCEHNYLLRLIETTRGDKGAACNLAGLSRAHLYQLLREHDIH